MIANHVHQALAQVRELQQKILERQRFKGYSGRARALTGTLALLTAAIMNSAAFPKSVNAVLLGWGIMFLVGFFLNYGSLFHWFLFDPRVKRDFRRLKPALDAIPALFVGGILTLTLIKNGDYHYLFGTWMCLFGLANLSSRYVLPPKIWLVGLFYVACGSLFFLNSGISFLNPWPVGIVFFVGEWAGGIVLHFDDFPQKNLSEIIAMLIFSKEDNHVHQI